MFRTIEGTSAYINAGQVVSPRSARRLLARALGLITATLTATGLCAQPLGPDNLSYEGSFRVPAGTLGGSTFAYGGKGLAWRDRNPGDPNDPGSLYLVGHAQDQLVAEISIPTPVISSSKNVAELPVASLLQPFADVTGGLMNSITSDPRLGGLAWLDRGNGGGELHWTVWQFYNVSGNQFPGHGYSSVNLNAPNGTGAWTVGNYHNQSTAGYLFDVPSGWADQNIGGKRLVSGQNSVTGNATSSWGPSMFAYDPAQHPVQPPPFGAALDVAVMANYPYSPNGENNFPNYKPTDWWQGASWISAGGQHAVVVVGSKALGETRYGAPQPGDCNQYQGYHGDPYEPQMLFFDPAELAAVANGSRNPSSIEASAIYRPQADIYKTCFGMLAGAAYDPDRQRLYITQLSADTLNQFEPMPLVHVYKVSSNGGGGSSSGGSSSGGSSSGGSSSGGSSSGGGGTPALTVGDTSVREADGRAVVDISLDRPANDTVSFVAFTRPISASPASDFLGFTRSLTIPAGQSQTTVEIDVVNDDVPEADETLALRLVNVTGDVNVVDGIGQIQIEDDDTYSEPVFSIAGSFVNESAGSAQIRVELYQAVDAEVTLFTQSGTADGRGRDYYGFTRELQFRNGETVKYIDVTINDDTESEDREYLLVRLTNARGAAIAQSRNLIWIQDND